ncbi:MAG: hypothetical protein LBQ65_05730 [Tannerellaceae bacterium]|jgi:hypothetical protein|nr:hypothetical protein [Tannerellaceae bacterium]
MYNIHKLFEGVKHPSVHIFKEKIACFPPEVQREYYHQAFRHALHDYDTQSKAMRTFFRRLVDAHLQEFLDYLLDKTILGTLRYRLPDPELFRKIAYCLARHTLVKDLAFALILSFSYKLKISSLSQYMKTGALDSADLADLLEILSASLN